MDRAGLSHPISRRALLRTAGATIGLAAVAPFIAACGQGAPPSSPAPSPQVVTKVVTQVVEKTAPATPVVKVITATPAAGVSSSLQSATLKFWTNHSAGDVPLFRQVIDNFQRQYPQIKIDMLNVTADFETKVATAGVGGSLPDSWYMRTYGTADRATKGWCISLNPYIQQDAKEVNTADFWPAELAQMTWKGNEYSLPYDFSTMAVKYNMDMFEKEGIPPPKPDWTWDDLLDTAKRFVKKEGNKQVRWGFQFVWYDWVTLGYFLGNGGQVFSEDMKKSVLNSPENVKTLQFFADLTNVHHVAPAPGELPQGVDPFAGELVAMAMTGSWSTIDDRGRVGKKFRYDVQYLPRGTTGKRALSAAGGAWNISRDSKARDQTWVWLKFLTNDESENILISLPLRSIPGRQSAAQRWVEVAQANKEPPLNIGIFLRQNSEAYAQVYPPYYSEWSTAYANRTQAVLNGQAKAADVLPMLDQEVDQIIAKYKF